MMKPDALVSAWETRLEGITGWKRSPLPFAVFGRTPNLVAHLAFAVTIARVEPIALERNRAADGVTVRADVRVRTLYKVRPGEKHVSELAGWEQLRLGIKQVLTGTDGPPAWPGGCAPTLSDAAGVVSDAGEWFLGELSFATQFRLDLS